MQTSTCGRLLASLLPRTAATRSTILRRYRMERSQSLHCTASANRGINEKYPRTYRRRVDCCRKVGRLECKEVLCMVLLVKSVLTLPSEECAAGTQHHQLVKPCQCLSTACMSQQIGDSLRRWRSVQNRKADHAMS
jgi:hypothetical protein